MTDYKEELIGQFLLEHESGIQTLYNQYVSKEGIKFIEFLSSLRQELYSNKDCLLSKSNDKIINNIDLLYKTNEYAKSLITKKVYEDKEYLCPGCLVFGKNSLLLPNKFLKCTECSALASQMSEAKMLHYYNIFSYHSLTGYKCEECKRFIPSNCLNSGQIFCPYFDCIFVGKPQSLKKMRHPTTSSKNAIYNTRIKISADVKKISTYISDDLQQQFLLLKSLIETQINELMYSKCNFTLNHKVYAYQAFDTLLDKYPKQMINYLMNNSRSGGFQNKLFQEYIRRLEESLPFVVRKNNKIIRIDNLLDSNLCIFDGISTFNAIVFNGSIKNNTSEYYIGGRQASYTKPYYIGKILNIVDEKNKSLNDSIIEYNFSKIRLRDIDNGTSVTVTHLRVPPHYQMGGMVYINRVRKNIIEAIKNI